MTMNLLYVLLRATFKVLPVEIMVLVEFQIQFS